MQFLGFFPLFFMRGCCGFLASLGAWRWLLYAGKMEVGTALFLSFLHASLHHPWDQKGDLLAQRGGGKQGEVRDLSRAVWRENGKAGICWWQWIVSITHVLESTSKIDGLKLDSLLTLFKIKKPLTISWVYMKGKCYIKRFDSRTWVLLSPLVLLLL